jgi:hypothetical protein
MVEIYLNPVDMSHEHEAQPTPMEQLRLQLNKAGVPDEAQKVVIQLTSTMPGVTTVPSQGPSSHFVVTQEEYKAMGKPTVGQHLNFDVQIYDEKNL